MVKDILPQVEILEHENDVTKQPFFQSEQFLIQYKNMDDITNEKSLLCFGVNKQIHSY